MTATAKPFGLPVAIVISAGLCRIDIVRLVNWPAQIAMRDQTKKRDALPHGFPDAFGHSVWKRKTARQPPIRQSSSI